MEKSKKKPPVHQAMAVESILPTEPIIEVNSNMEKSQTHGGETHSGEKKVKKSTCALGCGC